MPRSANHGGKGVKYWVGQKRIYAKCRRDLVLGQLKIASVILSEAKNLVWLGGNPTPDASPLRLAQHDIFEAMRSFQKLVD